MSTPVDGNGEVIDKLDLGIKVLHLDRFSLARLSSRRDRHY